MTSPKAGKIAPGLTSHALYKKANGRKYYVQGGIWVKKAFNIALGFCVCTGGKPVRHHAKCEGIRQLLNVVLAKGELGLKSRETITKEEQVSPDEFLMGLKEKGDHGMMYDEVIKKSDLCSRISLQKRGETHINSH